MIGIVQRFAAIGALPDDTEDERIRKGALTLASGIVSALAPIWIITYLILDLPVSAAIPFAYVVISRRVAGRARPYEALPRVPDHPARVASGAPVRPAVVARRVHPVQRCGALGADVSPRRADVRGHTAGGAVVRRVPGADRRLARARTGPDPGGDPRDRPGRVPRPEHQPACRSRRTCCSSTSCANASASTSAASGCC